MPDTLALVEMRNAFATKQQDLHEVFEAAATPEGKYDLTRATVLARLGAVDSADATSKIKARNRELEALGAELQQAELKAMADSQKEMEAARREPAHYIMQPGGPNDDLHRSFGDLFIKSTPFADAWMKHRSIGVPATLDIGLKTLFATTGGFQPESPRTGLMVPIAARPIEVLDLFPTRPIKQAVDKYMEETTRTPGAAEKGEGVAYAESTFVWTERTETVQKITDSVPVTDEQLEDAPEVSGLLNQRLTFGLKQKLETQAISGNGTPPALSGILDRTVQEQALGGDVVFDCVFKAITLVRHTGYANPNAIIMHPNDWQTVRLATTTEGEYIMGPPTAPGSQVLWGLPVAVSGAIAENTGLVGDFNNFCYIGERRGVDVQIGYSGTQFAEGKKLIRADLRACVSVTRAAAFCKMTGI